MIPCLDRFNDLEQDGWKLIMMYWMLDSLFFLGPACRDKYQATNVGALEIEALFFKYYTQDVFHDFRVSI